MSQKKIKVVFFIYYLGSGGAGRTFLNILNNIDRDRFEPILVTCNYDGSYERYLNDNTKFIKLSTKRLRSAIFPLSRIIREEKADIVFSTIPNYNIIAIIANLLSFTRAKNIVREAAFLGESTKEKLKLKIYGLFYKSAKKIVALSNGVKGNLIQKYHVPEKKIQVIYNPVDLGQIDENIGKQQQMKNNGNIIVTAGRLVKEKDHGTLFRALAHVTQEHSIQLWVLGDGPLREDLEELAENLGIRKQIHFLGFQQNPYHYFHQANLFVLTSKTEGFGHVLVEALAVGVPIVTTNCRPGAEEVLENGTYGIITPVGDDNALANSIKRALSMSPQQRDDMIQRGLNRAQDFHANKIVKEYEQLFLDTLK